MNQTTNPYARIDALERDVLQVARQCAELAAMCAQQAAMLAHLMQSLGESAESLPGEHAPERTSRGRSVKPS